MKYTDSPERAAELFRLALPMLGTYKLVPNPVNFALCYHYLSGASADLNADFDKLVDSDGGCTNEACELLFQQYIWDDDKKMVDKLRTDLSRLIVETFDNVGEAQSEASLSAEKLTAHSKKLNKNTSLEDMQHILTEVVKETKQVAENGHTLKSMLDDTKSEIERLRQELEITKHEAITDPLTGLKNRRAFEKAMRESMDNIDGYERDLCLVMVDIDHFKRVNDNYGHVFGDKVLKLVSSMLLSNIKGKDTIARLGGEEFAVMLPDTRLEIASIVAENLRLAVEGARIKKTNSGEFLEKITVSLGVTHFLVGETTDEFIDRADKALYKSKETGRNRVTTQT